MDDTLAMSCTNVYEDFNDVTSSIEVYRNTFLGEANGYWTSLTGSTDFHYEITVGFSSTHKEATTTENQYQLSYEMTAGINFKIESFSESIKQSYLYDIQKNVEDINESNVT